ncbi:hypothetical protein SLNWT_0459 [Streptomyces albus]|uniref:Uncharacterized protein n=1 Tax=Streptomyces albus (strain ATCC 21838 / DSM 41398 / FERM P-419 / JCM 4703 / NBRC 107858) TaxID=1081613 RepID=A0A0B5ENG7_STRA4|nr:hypothetical protein SLNWT_0459 [Streptomyces albus]AOU75147.1 hypothetical protein SLNHY_0456 [Streptomyces albus]
MVGPLGRARTSGTAPTPPPTVTHTTDNALPQRLAPRGRRARTRA